jgi:hypothetical protein
LQFGVQAKALELGGQWINVGLYLMEEVEIRGKEKH